MNYLSSKHSFFFSILASTTSWFFLYIQFHFWQSVFSILCQQQWWAKLTGERAHVERESTTAQKRKNEMNKYWNANESGKNQANYDNKCAHTRTLTRQFNEIRVFFSCIHQLQLSERCQFFFLSHFGWIHMKKLERWIKVIAMEILSLVILWCVLNPFLLLLLLLVYIEYIYASIYAWVWACLRLQCNERKIPMNVNQLWKRWFAFNLIYLSIARTDLDSMINAFSLPTPPFRFTFFYRLLFSFISLELWCKWNGCGLNSTRVALLIRFIERNGFRSQKSHKRYTEITTTQM